MGKGIFVAYLQVSLEIPRAADGRQQFGGFEKSHGVRRPEPLLEFELDCMSYHILPSSFVLAKSVLSQAAYGKALTPNLVIEC